MSRFQIWVDSPSDTNSLSYDALASDSQRSSGFQPGTAASSTRVNSMLRQNSLVVAALMDSILAASSTIDLRSSRDAVKTEFSTFFGAFATKDELDQAIRDSKATLYAPTISLSGNILTIVNPASNGDFVTSYSVFVDNELALTTTDKTVDLTSLVLNIGAHSIAVRCNGTNFYPSPFSNVVRYLISVLATPQNVSVEGTTLSWDEVENATSYAVLADGTSIGEVNS